MYRRTVRQLEPGATLTVSNDLLADFVPGTAAVSLAVSSRGAIDVPALLQALDRYPYGCSEQIVSRALPLLYVNKLAAMQSLAQDGDIDMRVRDAIERVLSRQNAAGDFGLWGTGGVDDVWLNAFVTDFLTRARENNFAVPQIAFDAALDHLRNTVANFSEFKSDQASGVAYAVYVLARNGRPVMGDLRYLADTKLNDFDSPLARGQLGAALAMLGDRGRADVAFGSAVEKLTTLRDGRSRSDYGSRLRDGAGLMALAAESNITRPDVQRASMIVEDERAARTYTSTQDNSWMVLAAQAITKEADALAVTVDGAARRGPVYRTWAGFTLDQRSIPIANVGSGAARIVLTTSGNPMVPEPAAAQGYSVARDYFGLDGKKLDVTKIRQNDRFVVVLNITELEAAYARLLLVDPLPAGLEIDNPDLVGWRQHCRTRLAETCG